VSPPDQRDQRGQRPPGYAAAQQPAAQGPALTPRQATAPHRLASPPAATPVALTPVPAPPAAGVTPRAEAVALAYYEGDAAPRVVAKGRGLLAEEIIRRAREAGVFVHESRELVAVLTKLDLDSHIPPQLYLAIAEILAWVYRMEQGGLPSEHPAVPAVAGLLARPRPVQS
jgi:flagellar biosynthesis protein